jgi:hypothetical protein
MFISFHRFVRDEDGQAIVLAAVGMLVMALSVLMTAFWGYAVYEKIKLQNNADSTAYSLAVMEARVLNYMAYLNRAMIANYVRMIALQSLLSYLTWVEAALATLHDMNYNIYAMSCMCACGCSCSQFCCNPACFEHPNLAISQTLAPFVTTMGQLVDQFDRLISPQSGYIYILQEQNKALSIAQNRLKFAVYFMTLSFTEEFTKKNDDELNWSVLSFISPLINALIWDKATKPKPFRNTDVNDKRYMAEIVNASRFDIAQTKRDVVPFGGLSEGSFEKGQHTGQTKLIDSTFAYGDPESDIHGTQYMKSDLADGAVLAAFDKQSIIPIPPCINNNKIEVYVWDANRMGEHKRLIQSQKYKTCIGCGCVPASLDGGTTGRTTNIEVDYTDQNHKGFRGITNFITFNPHDNPDTYFGQPITFCFLNKPPERFKMKPVWRKSRIMGDTYSAEINTDLGDKGVLTSGLLRGINAMSLAQVYYHRPYTWKEQPNLFNPYWRARLIAFGERDGKILPAWLSWATGINFPSDIIGFITKGLVLH